MEKTPARRAPDIGEHGRDVLRELGYHQARIAELIDAGVVRAAGAR